MIEMKASDYEKAIEEWRTNNRKEQYPEDVSPWSAVNWIDSRAHEIAAARQASEPAALPQRHEGDSARGEVAWMDQDGNVMRDIRAVRCDGCGCGDDFNDHKDWARYGVVVSDETVQKFIHVGHYCKKCKKKNFAYKGHLFGLETKENLLADRDRLAAELAEAKRDAKSAYERGRNDQHRQLADAMYPRERT